MSLGPVSPPTRFDELWKRIGGVLGGEGSVPARVAEAALLATGARDATVYLKEKDCWVRAGEKLGGPAEPVDIPEPLPEGAWVRDGHLWLPLAAEGEVHGVLKLLDVPEGEASEHAAMLAFLDRQRSAEEPASEDR